jgi:hypothetical protein
VKLKNGIEISTLGLIKEVDIEEGESGKGLDEITQFIFYQTAIETDSKIRSNQCIKIQLAST